MCRVLFVPRSHAPTYLPCDGNRDKSITTATAPDSLISRTDGDCVSALCNTWYPDAFSFAISGPASVDFQ